MKGIFNLIYESGPHGDECTTYKIELMPKVTLESFLFGVTSNFQEHGSIMIAFDESIEKFDYNTEDDKNIYSYLKIDNKPYSWLEIKYGYGGHIIDCNKPDIFNKYKNTVLKNNDWNWANGGWSAMDYWLKIE